VRKLSATSAAGALLGLLVGGVGGRLAMALLAAQNPEDAGKLTNDGFRIGQFSLSGTLQLFGTALQLALLGSLAYLVLRPLAVGPRWLRVASFTVGATAVVGAIVIHPGGGPDFSVLDPDWLPVVLFLVIPAVYTTLFCLLADRWLAPDSWFSTASIRKVGAVLLVWVASGPLVLLLPIALGVGVAWRVREKQPSPTSAAGQKWAARALLAVIGVWALAVLVSNIDAVT
jgi:hypothetical protein